MERKEFLDKLLLMQEMWDDVLYGLASNYVDDDINLEILELYEVSPFFNTFEIDRRNGHQVFAKLDEVAIDNEQNLACYKCEYDHKLYATLVKTACFKLNGEELKRAVYTEVVNYLKRCKESVCYKHPDINEHEYNLILKFLKHV